MQMQIKNRNRGYLFRGTFAEHSRNIRGTFLSQSERSISRGADTMYLNKRQSKGCTLEPSPPKIMVVLKILYYYKLYVWIRKKCSK